MSKDDNQTMQSFYMQLGDSLDQYTALAKFMEQAFEWSVMDYTFYPYYWANKERWDDLYLTEDLDPLFRSFLQAGMARVIVTVKCAAFANIYKKIESNLQTQLRRFRTILHEYRQNLEWWRSSCNW
jgi:hypothetical protein